MTLEHYQELLLAKKRIDKLFAKIYGAGPLTIGIKEWNELFKDWKSVRNALDCLPKPQPSEQCPGCGYFRQLGHGCTKCGTFGNDRV